MTEFLFLADFSVIKPDPGLIFWTALIFILLWGILGRAAFRPIQNALKKREKDIQDSLNQAERAREAMEGLKAENEKLIAEAREESTKILKAAKEAATDFEKEQRVRTKEKMQKMITDASLQIEHQKMEAIIDLKNQVGNMALDIATKVLKKELEKDPKRDAFVNTLVDEMDLNSK